MSRIGNNPVPLSEGTTVSVADGIVTVKGKLGELFQKVDSSITISVNENEVVLTRDSEDKEVRSMHGLYRSLIANMVEGVSKGFEKKLEIVGVGYRAKTAKNKMGMNNFTKDDQFNLEMSMFIFIYKELYINNVILRYF